MRWLSAHHYSLTERRNKGFATPPVRDWSEIRNYKRSKGRLTLIGCGGVFTSEDAYKKIRLWATLVQLITGMIYNGPQTISEINQGLARLLRRDGFTNVVEAVGVDAR